MIPPGWFAHISATVILTVINVSKTSLPYEFLEPSKKGNNLMVPGGVTALVNAEQLYFSPSIVVRRSRWHYGQTYCYSKAVATNLPTKPFDISCALNKQKGGSFL